MEQRILITGSSGFLGSILSDKLSKMGYRILTLGRKSTDSIYADLRDNSFRLPVETHNIGMVIHAAGKAHLIPKTEQDAKAFFDVNFEGTKNLCHAITSLQKIPKAFIFISTVAVYGLDSGELISEEQPLKGITPYAKSKIMAEEWLQNWAKRYNIVLSILRLPLIAGKDPGGNLGAIIKGIGSRRYASIGDASAKKSIVWAEDVACIVPQLAESGGIYNLTDDHHPSFRELEHRIASLLGKKDPPRISVGLAKLFAFLGDALGDSFPFNSDKLKKITATLTFDSSKAKRILNWQPSNVLDKLSQVIYEL